jgi:hypothetical protein
MNKDCLSEEILQGYLEGTLEEPAARPVQAHLEACPACDAKYRKTSLLFTRLEGVPRFEPPPDFTSRVMDRVPVPVNVGALPWTKYLAAGLSLFAVSMILIVTGLRPYFANSPFVLSQRGSEVLHRASAMFFNIWETGRMIMDKLSLLFSSAGKILLSAGWQIPCLFFAGYIIMGGLCLWMLWSYSMRKPARQSTNMPLS